MIHLDEVTPENWRLGLHVSEAQARYVSDADRLLARAWAYRAQRSRALVIYDGDTPVGMALYYDADAPQAYVFSQLFIDEAQQGRGYGTEAARQILRAMEQDGKYDRAVLCYVEGNETAKRMYEKLGFRLTGEADGDEIIMEKRLR